MIDVHAPEETPHGVRDFLIHLFTITVGLLIALGLEGAVEWQHHRHLAHDAEMSMQREIKSNADGMADTLNDLHKEQAALKHDVTVLDGVIQTGKFPEHSSMEITFHIRTFADLSWSTAQTTGALAYMPYARAEEFDDVYKTQNALAVSEEQAARDAVVSLAPLLDTDNSGAKMAVVEAEATKAKIQTLQGQLMLVDSFMNSLDKHYKKFLAAHPQ